MKAIIRALCAAGLLLAPIGAAAADYPERAVTFVIPFPPGGSSDVYARYLTESLSKLWGKPAVVENMGGAGSSIGMANVARSEKDGYRLALTSSTFATSAAAQTNLPYDPAADLQPIAKVADGQLVVVTGSRVPMATVDDLVREAKAQTIFYGATGPASTPTFLAKQLADVTGIEMAAANYKGGAEALVDLVGGRIDVYIGTITAARAAIEAGTATPIAVLGANRSALLPDVPTIAEAGYPDAGATVWFGVFGPAGMPEDVVEKLNADIATVMSTPEAATLLATQGADPALLSVAEFEDLVRSELARWKGLAERFEIVAN
jgi:tripartite-type tricarboxylate transporter receptor subunit TctC